GPVSCYDVFAFIGGQVKIHCFPNTDVYFCKYNVRSQCEQRRIINNRFTLGGSKGSVQMTIRNLSFQDAGMYECGLLSWRSNIQLKVYNDPCCIGTQSVRRSLGQNVMINCSYPVEFKNSFKYLYKLEGESENQLIYTSGTRQNQEGRFSISVDERKNVFHVIINELTEDDKGVYSCVLWERDTSVGYYSFFREIHLQVTGEENPDGTLNTRHPESIPRPGFSVNTIISMCICVSLLLLIGAFVLVYKLKGRKTQGT
ncbi:polymeric immunoglobulin receptor-like, partial [Silurus asotus]